MGDVDYARQERVGAKGLELEKLILRGAKRESGAPILTFDDACPHAAYALVPAFLDDLLPMHAGSLQDRPIGAQDRGRGTERQRDGDGGTADSETARQRDSETARQTQTHEHKSRD